MRRTLRAFPVLIVAAAVTLLCGPRTGAAEDKAAPAGTGPRGGQPAPDFALKDQNGKTVKLSDFKSKIVVIHWFNDSCPFIERHYEAKTFTAIDDKYRDKGVIQLAVDSTGANSAAEDDRKWVASHGLKYPILIDSDRKVARAYDAKTTPHMFVIGRDGKLAYQGAIDNDPEGNKPGRVNYVAKALDELLAGKPVSEPETKSYGCGVSH